MKIGTLGAGTVAQAIADAKTTVKDLTAAVGFAPVDLGSLREGGRLMQLGGPLSGLHALKQD
ncbi:hypothetical protein [Streptomyces sp. NRRL B-24720]|uniref:hypothetical protein n=1 Tax=Streptomyces sp. NRRL B-24720 TaxID=1476876 RepID=UPI0004C965FE